MIETNLPIAVVGAGAGGLPAAVALAEAGLKVILIERGSEVDHEKVKTDQFNYELDSPWTKFQDEWKGPVKLNRGIGIGGSTLYYQGVSHLPPQKVFDSWGITSDIMGPISKEVTEFLQIAGIVQPAHKLNAVSQHLLEAAKQKKWRARVAPVAILSKPTGDRPACNHCGLCIYGCRPKDRSSVDNTWYPRFKKNANAEIIVEASVISLELSNARQVSSITIKTPSGTKILPVKAVVLAAGALETPFLLKNSLQELAPEGIGNKHVGRNLVSTIWHSLLVAQHQIDGPGYVGVPSDILIEEFIDQGILMGQSRNMAGITGPISAAKYYQNFPDNKGVRTWMRHYYPRLAGLYAFAESSVDFNDGLSTSGIKAFSKNLKNDDHLKLKKMRALLNQWADKAKAEILNENGSESSHVSSAMMRGTCRMGSDPDTSAVTPTGQLRGYDNIVISDASVLGSGMISDPSLTLQVLGLYFGRELAKKYTL